METNIEINSKNVPGLMDLIREAMTEEEVNKLVTNGKWNYLNASPKTIRKWDRIAKQRIMELKIPYDSTEELKEVKKVDKKKPVKK